MGRTTKQLSGGGKDKFLRALIAAQEELAGAPADKLAARLADAITDIRVKRDVWDELGSDLKKGKGLKGRAARQSVQDASPKAAAAPAMMEKPAAPAPAEPPAQSTAFDPFAFSALATLTRGGKNALEAKLREITAAEHLIALAAAQHLGIDRSLADVVTLRTAIVAATEARLRERRAAAS